MENLKTPSALTAGRIDVLFELQIQVVSLVNLIWKSVTFVLKAQIAHYTNSRPLDQVWLVQIKTFKKLYSKIAPFFETLWVSHANVCFLYVKKNAWVLFPWVL